MKERCRIMSYILELDSKYMILIHLENIWTNGRMKKIEYNLYKNWIEITLISKFKNNKTQNYTIKQLM